MLIFVFLSALLYLPLASAQAAATGTQSLEIEALLAKVGREAVLLSDLRRFADVDSVLDCAGVVHREKPLPSDQKALLEVYIDEELLYQEARTKKTTTAGMIPQAVQIIMSHESCRKRWQKLGEEYSVYWRTEARQREGESLLVRELEKRVLVEKFRKTEVVADMDLWKREARVRYPVKIYVE